MEKVESMGLEMIVRVRLGHSDRLTSFVVILMSFSRLLSTSEELFDPLNVTRATENPQLVQNQP